MSELAGHLNLLVPCILHLICRSQQKVVVERSPTLACHIEKHRMGLFVLGYTMGGAQGMRASGRGNRK